MTNPTTRSCDPEIVDVSKMSRMSDTNLRSLDVSSSYTHSRSQFFGIKNPSCLGLMFSNNSCTRFNLFDTFMIKSLHILTRSRSTLCNYFYRVLKERADAFYFDTFEPTSYKNSFVPNYLKTYTLPPPRQRKKIDGRHLFINALSL